MGERAQTAVLVPGLFLMAVAIGCGGSSERSSGNGAKGGGGTSAGSASGGNTGGRGVRVPDGPIDSTGGNTNDVAVDSSTLGRDANGQIRLLFTFENRGPSAICAQTFRAKLFDASGAVLAGSDSGIIETEGVPGFDGELIGHSHRSTRADGVVFVATCVSPGQRGAGFAQVWSQMTGDLTADEVTRILDRTARIELWFPPGSVDADTAVPAPDVLALESAALENEGGNKLVRGYVVAAQDQSYFRIRAIFFDDTGRIVDLSSQNGTALNAGARREFETSPGDPTAVRFEPFLMAGFL